MPMPIDAVPPSTENVADTEAQVLLVELKWPRGSPSAPGGGSPSMGHGHEERPTPDWRVDRLSERPNLLAHNLETRRNNPARFTHIGTERKNKSCARSCSHYF